MWERHFVKKLRVLKFICMAQRYILCVRNWETEKLRDWKLSLRTNYNLWKNFNIDKEKLNWSKTMRAAFFLKIVVLKKLLILFHQLPAHSKNLWIYWWMEFQQSNKVKSIRWLLVNIFTICSYHKKKEKN
jgi:hypothetical protein